MIGNRTRFSLAQLLEQQQQALVVALIAKHGGRISLGVGTALEIMNALRNLDDHQVMAVCAEVIATSGDLRHRVTPKYRFDERSHDLVQCLALDGYEVVDKRLRQTDPTIAEAPPIDDDLIEALKGCGAPRRHDITQKIADSAAAFRSSPPDYNAALVNARVAMETLAADIAIDVAGGAALPPFDPSKWGSTISYLRTRSAITLEEERGLAGVYAFLSSGAHRPMPIGVSEAQMTRLGRSFALNVCWFLLQTHLARRGP